ncbi:MAG TPA: hypothetical protein PKZ76_03305 [Xanthomonadaceae bacterium]|nr:hypothetical protein [Xanthomonadaceae bacterium]
MFRHCTWNRQLLAGMTKAVLIHHDISAQEVLAVCRLRRVPVGERDIVLSGVRVMADAAAPVLNSQATESG